MTGPAPVTGVRAWVGSAVLVAALLAGLHALDPLIAPGPWTTVAMLLVVGVAAVTASARRAARSRTAPTLWGLLAGVAAVAVVYSGTGTSPSVPLPTPSTGERLVRLGASGVTAIIEGRVPLEPVRGVEMLVVAGAVLAFLVADLVALGLGRGGLSGLVLVGLWVPSALFERAPGTGWLLLGGVTFLVLLTLTRPQATGGARGVARDTAPALVAAAVVAVVAVVTGPLLAATPVFGSVTLGGGGWGSGPGNGPLRLSTDLDMRNSLGARSERTILTYTTDGGSPGPLRMYTVTEFDGREWQRSRASSDLRPLDGVLWPTELPAPAPDDGTGSPLDDEPDRVTITVGALDQDRLPIPIEPRQVAIDPGWRYDALQDEVVGSGASTSGRSYDVTITPRDLSEEALRADRPRSGLPADSPYLAIPATTFAADIAEVARQVTAEATSAYDQALALQMYFRDASAFRYDTEVPAAQTDDAVWDFLNSRTGFCVQYATAMTVMARTLGIPSRLATGFLPGRASREVVGEFVVSGRQAHAWPELWFEEAGWVRFEPTPAAQTGAPPAYADPFGGVPFATPEPGLGTATQAPQTPGAVPGQAGAGAPGEVNIGGARFSVPVAVGLGALVVAGLVLLGVGWTTRRRRRAAAVPDLPEAWWAVLRTRLATHGITWSDAMTPRQAAAEVREQMRRRSVDDDDARRALRDLVASVERERYAPDPALPDAADLAAWVAAVEAPFVVREPELSRR